MALRYVLAAFSFGTAIVNAQTTDSSDPSSVSDYYNYGYTSRSTKTPMFWTATLRLQDWTSISTYTRYSGATATYREKSVRTIKPTVTPTATPTFTSTYSLRYEDVAVIELYYPENAVPESEFVPTSTYGNYDSTTSSDTMKPTTYSSTQYFMPVTMTAPSSCSRPFTVATQASITYIPTIITDQLKPTSTDVSTSSYNSFIIEYANWYLPAGAAPFTSTNDFYYSYYIASCTPPPASSTGGTRSSSGGGSSSDESWTDYNVCYFGGCTTLKTWIIIICTVLPGIFLLGFLESWFWYTRLMKGKSAVRCGTVCWVLLSLWVLCFIRMQDARSKEDQALLQQKWKDMPAGQKFKNWSWGFKRRYPVPLLGQFSKQTVGIVPEGQPLHPAMAQAPQGQVFYYGPPPPGAPGYPMPPQGYPKPVVYHAADVPKGGVVVGSTPVYQQTVPGATPSPQTPQSTYLPPTSPPPSVQPPPQSQLSAPLPAPPANVSEVPASQPASVPAVSATTQPPPTHFAPAKNDTNDDLYK